MERTTPRGKAKLKKRGNSNVSRYKKPNAKRQRDGIRINHHKISAGNKENTDPPTGGAATVVGLNKSLYPPSLSNSAGSGRLAGLRSSKAKVSETVTARRVLGSLHANTDQPPSSQDRLQLDLQRVLGKSESSSCSSITSHPPGPAMPSPRQQHPMTPPSPQVPPPPPPAASSSSTMDVSPAVDSTSSGGVSVPVAEIGQRIVEGLQVDAIFPNSTYLQDVKAELRKVFKQCNPYSYEELVGYFTRPNESSPTPTPPPPPDLPLPPAPPPPMFGHTFTDPIPSSVVVLNPPLLPSSESHMTGHVSDLVALNLEVNTSALNINDRITPEDGQGSSAAKDLRPRDFLDLLDTTPSCHTQKSTPLSSPLGWSNTPSRPRLFPHKLY